MAQKILSQSYCRDLKDHIDSKKYLSPHFFLDSSKLNILQGVNENPMFESRVSDILKADKPNLSLAILLYESYPDLNNLQATYESFWAYLSHTIFFDFLRKGLIGHFKDGKDEGYLREYILNNWFLYSMSGSFSHSSIMRHPLAGLWWAVKISIYEPEENSDLYVLTRILFRQKDFYSRTLGTYSLGRFQPAVKAVLEYIYFNPLIFENSFEAKTRFVCKYLNRYFGSRPLSAYSKDDILNVLTGYTAKISSVK
jgi:hypothetical protein